MTQKAPHKFEARLYDVLFKTENLAEVAEWQKDINENSLKFVGRAVLKFIDSLLFREHIAMLYVDPITVSSFTLFGYPPPRSLTAFCEVSVKDLPVGTAVQFERLGFFAVDPDTKVRAASISCFNIIKLPFSWTCYVVTTLQINMTSFRTTAL